VPGVAERLGADDLEGELLELPAPGVGSRASGNTLTSGATSLVLEVRVSISQATWNSGPAWASTSAATFECRIAWGPSAGGT
jgi:hypothetical protein